MLPREHDPAERRLVEECLAGNREAWEELYQRLLQRAPNAIYRAHQSVKRYAPEEVAAEVFRDLRGNKGKKIQAFLQGTKGLDAFLNV
jgi:hypothetical protein